MVIELFVGPKLIFFFEVLIWRKLMLIKYYHNIDDVDIGGSLKHLIWGALLWMV